MTKKKESFHEKSMDGMEFGFSASGWLMVYQLGVAHALQRHRIYEAKGCKFIGSSGGAAVSAALSLNSDCELLRDFMLRCCSDYHQSPMRNMFKMREYAKNCIIRCMEDKTFEELNSGKLNVAITVLPKIKKAVVNKFASNEEYVEAVLASCTMSPLAGFPFQLNRPKDKKLHGAWVFDGGMTALIPTLSENTITCSAFYCFDADIKPSRYVPLYWAAFPPSVAEMRELFWLGAHDGEVWLHRNGFSTYKIDKHVLRASQRVEFQRIRPLLPISPVTPMSSENCHVSYINMASYDLDARSRSSGSTDSSDTSMYRRIIQHDALYAGHEISSIKEPFYRMRDNVAYVTMASFVTPMALGVVYVELWSKAIIHGISAALSTVERKRRDSVASKERAWSLRRYVHSEMIANSAESWEKTKDYVATALNPTLLVHQLPCSNFFVSNDEAWEAHERLENASKIYSYFQKWVYWY